MLDLIKRFLTWLASHNTTPTPVPEPAAPAKPTRPLAWGAKVSAEFRAKLFEVADALGIPPDYLMACIAFETAETFRPDIRNAAGSGATGLIQFMPATARGLGTTTDALARMTAVEQLDYVRMYFKPYAGRLKTLSDVYMAILWPKGIGKPEDYVLWHKGTHPTTYRQNAGLDIDLDHDIEKQEAAAKVQAKFDKGLRSENVWRGE